MSLVNTRIQNFRNNDAKIDKNESRASRYGATNTFENHTNDPNGFVTDELKSQAENSQGTTLSMSVLDFDGSVTVSNTTIPLVIPDSPNTSQLVDVSFQNYFFGFKIYPSRHKNNEISMQREFNRQLEKHIYKFLAMVEANNIAALETAKTQVLNDTLGGRYALTGNTVVAPLAEQDFVIGDINPLFAGNDFFGNIDIIANASMESHVRNRLGEKGQFNSEDKRYQYGDKSFQFTNSLSNGAGQKATAFAVQKGSLGLLKQYAADCLLGNKSHNHEWGIETLPIANIPVGVYTYDGAENASGLDASTAHLTSTLVQAYGFHIGLAPIVTYNSDPASRASDIMKIAISST